MNDAMTLAIVLAGGTGTRMDADLPKQLLEVGGKTLLEMSVAAFERCDGVDTILVMMSPDHVREGEEVVARAGFAKVIGVAAGGSTRRETTHLALRLAPPGTRDVLVHDAARPLVSQEVIQRCLNALVDHEAVSSVVPLTDTIYRVAADGRELDEVLSRSAFRLAQTPQAFRLALLLAAHERAAAETDETLTDDAGIMARYLPAVSIQLVEGALQNIKVTVATDLKVAEVLQSPKQR